MRIVNFAVGILLAAAMAFGYVESGFAQNTLTSSPAVSVATGTSAAPIQQVLPQNPGRKQAKICNVGTNVVWIWPGTATPVSAYELPALSTGTTTCFTEPDGAVGPGGAGHGQAWYMESVTSGVGTVAGFEWF
jgi:hypothetical protein